MIDSGIWQAIRTEASKPPLWVAVIGISVFYFGLRSGHNISIDEYIADIVGPDIVVLMAANSISVASLIGGLLVGWWRVTAVCNSPMQSERRAVTETCLGLTALLSAVFIGSTALSIALHVPRFGVPSPLLLLGFNAITTGYTALCILVGAAIGVVTGRSLLGRLAAGAAFVFVIFFQVFAHMAHDVVTPGQVDIFYKPADPLLFFLHRWAPMEAYIVVTNWLYGIGNSSSDVEITIAQLYLPPGADDFLTNAFVAEHTFGGTVPWFLSEWVSLVVLTLWAASAGAVLHWRLS